MPSTPKTTPAAKAAKASQPAALLGGVRFTADYRCFKQDRQIELRPGVNLLVGEQGAGKSSLMQALIDRAKKGPHAPKAVLELLDISGPFAFAAFDFEKGNPRTQGHFGDDVGFQVASMFKSHGETVRALLAGLAGLKEPTLVLLDEPDMALSPRSAHRLAAQLSQMAADGHQVLASVHNPIVIASQPKVLSMEHKKWMTSKAFLADHAKVVDEQ